VLPLHISAPRDMAVVWLQLLLSAVDSQLHGGSEVGGETPLRISSGGAGPGVASQVPGDHRATEARERVDRVLALLLAILTEGERGDQDVVRLVQWQQALHLSMLVAAADGAASGEQRVLCALVTASAAILQSLPGPGALAGLVSPSVLARWLLSYPFDALGPLHLAVPSMSTSLPASTGVIDGDKGRGHESKPAMGGTWVLLQAMLLQSGGGLSPEEGGSEKCARLFGWLVGPQQTPRCAQHSSRAEVETERASTRTCSSIDLDALCAALVELATADGATQGRGRGTRIEICNLEALCLISLPASPDAETDECCQGRCLGEMLRRAAQGNDTSRQASVLVSRWQHDALAAADTANSHVMAVQQVEVCALGELVDQVVSQAWVYALQRAASMSASARDPSLAGAARRMPTEPLRHLALQKMQNASTYPESFGLLLRHKAPAVRVQVPQKSPDNSNRALRTRFTNTRCGCECRKRALLIAKERALRKSPTHTGYGCRRWKRRR
jgi:hypothetical protein